ncbi:MAG: complex I subunit 5 family protein [Spirochaetota bacterium]
MSQAIIAVVLVPLSGAILASLLVIRSERWTRALVTGVAIAHAGAVAIVAVGVSATGGSVYHVGGWAAPIGIVLVADPLSVFFLILVSLGHVTFLAHASIEERGERKGLWTLTELFVTALSGMILAGDLFNLFVFIELASVSSVGLITHKQRAEGAGAGFVYLMFASVSGLFFLAAVILVYAAAGSLTLAAVSATVTSLPNGSYRAVVGLLTASLGMKFGLVPFHLWQAPAYDAAGSTVAGLLSGTGMKAYLYVLIRLLIHALRAGTMISHSGLVLLLLGLANILVGHLLALAERDVKRLLAFSSVAHVGYILVAVATVLSVQPNDPTSLTAVTAATAAAAAALLHIAFHALIKTTLFYAGRTLVNRAGTAILEGLRGIARVEPIGFGSFVLAAIALIGIPPASGFYSKWRIAVEAHRVFGAVPVAVIAAGTVISTFYYARVLHLGLAAPQRPASGRIGSARPTLALVAILALATMVAGGLGTAVETLFEDAARAFVDAERYLLLVLGGG